MPDQPDRAEMKCKYRTMVTRRGGLLGSSYNIILQFPGAWSGRARACLIYKGKKVVTQQLWGDTAILPLTDIPKQGRYHIELYTEEGLWTEENMNQVLINGRNIGESTSFLGHYF